MLKDLIIQALKKVSDSEKVEVSIPENDSFGDYSTNIAFIIGKDTLTSPVKVAMLLKAEIEKQLNDRERRKKIREALGTFLAEGQNLMLQCSNEKNPPPNDEADEWAYKVEHCLSHELNSSYVAIFVLS